MNAMQAVVNFLHKQGPGALTLLVKHLVAKFFAVFIGFMPTFLGSPLQPCIPIIQNLLMNEDDEEVRIWSVCFKVAAFAMQLWLTTSTLIAFARSSRMHWVADRPQATLNLHWHIVWRSFLMSECQKLSLQKSSEQWRLHSISSAPWLRHQSILILQTLQNRWYCKKYSTAVIQSQQWRNISNTSLPAEWIAPISTMNWNVRCLLASWCWRRQISWRFLPGGEKSIHCKALSAFELLFTDTVIIDDSQILHTVRNLRAIPALVNLLSYPNHHVQHEAVRCLTRIAAKSDELRNSVLAAHVLPPLLSLYSQTIDFSFSQNPNSLFGNLINEWMEVLSMLCQNLSIGDVPPPLEQMLPLIPFIHHLLELSHNNCW